MLAIFKKFVARFTPLWNIPGEDVPYTHSQEQVLLEKFIASLSEIHCIVTNANVRNSMLSLVKGEVPFDYRNACDLDSFSLAAALETRLTPPMEVYAESLAMWLSSARAYGSELCLSPRGRVLMRGALTENFYYGEEHAEQDSDWVRFEIFDENLKFSFRFYNGKIEALPERSFDELGWAATTV